MQAVRSRGGTLAAAFQAEGLIDELLLMLADDATELGCRTELERARDIAVRGTSADLQLAVYREALAGGAQPDEARRAVVDWLISATMGDVAAEP